MKNKELDHVDREILRMLQENARMSLKDIAEAVFLSSPAVSVRIDNMIEAGYIEGFHATVNPVKMGYHELDQFIGELQQYGRTKTLIVFSTSVEHRGVHVDGGFNDGKAR